MPSDQLADGMTLRDEKYLNQNEKVSHLHIHLLVAGNYLIHRAAKTTNLL